MTNDYVNREAIRAETSEELERALREDSMPAAVDDAMREELKRRYDERTARLYHQEP